MTIGVETEWLPIARDKEGVNGSGKTRSARKGINQMPGRKPNKKELAKMKVMSDLGLSPTAIADKLGRSHNTVIKYLDSDVYNDPTIGEIVEKIKEKEINDLIC